MSTKAKKALEPKAEKPQTSKPLKAINQNHVFTSYRKTNSKPNHKHLRQIVDSVVSRQIREKFELACDVILQNKGLLVAYNDATNLLKYKDFFESKGIINDLPKLLDFQTEMKVIFNSFDDVSKRNLDRFAKDCTAIGIKLDAKRTLKSVFDEVYNFYKADTANLWAHLLES